MSEQTERLNVALADRYRVEREIGHGGMATVYLAHDLRHDRPVAIKVLHPELSVALGAERFLREIRITARLSHPHILPLLDSGEARGLLFYVMPFIAGESLRERLTRERQLPVGDATRIATQVAGALAYAHAQGVVHRDIKPENILLGGGQAMVADFGIARALHTADPGRLTGAGLAVGTPAYMSPEQATGEAAVDGRADLYSLGCVLFEMLAGRPPFVGATPESVVAQHVAAEPPALGGIRHTVPARLASAVQRALAKAPADRFATAEELAQALELGSGDGIAGAPPAARAAPARARALLASAALLMVLLTIALLLPGRARMDPLTASRPWTAIAVLPFQNLSPDGPHAYFAGGLHDEILTQLARVAALTVVSRTSVSGFAARGLSVRQIADSLGVGSIVDGSVQVVDGRLRVSVQLIDPATDAPIWADRYDRTLDDAFAIQSDVAQQIVTAVGAALSTAERRSIAEAPTANPESYRLYLQGREYFTRPGQQRQAFEAAEALYTRAIALDSGFALARAALAEVHGLMFLLRYDSSPERLDRLRTEAEAALRLAPDLPKAHEAMGMAHGIVDGDLRRGVEALQRAARGLPNDARLQQKLGFNYRNLGVWDSALAAFRRATVLDPHDADLFFHLGATEDLAREYDRAVRSQQRAMELAPDLHMAGIAAGWARARASGRLDSLEAVLGRLPRFLSLGPHGEVTGQRAALYYLRRDPEGLLRVLAEARVPAFEWEMGYEPVPWLAAQAHRLRGDSTAARAALDTTLAMIESRLAARPGDWPAVAARGQVHAQLGRRAAARQDAEALGRVTRARYPGGYTDVRIREGQARIFAQLGDTAAALPILRELLSQPGWLSRALLPADPAWDLIREQRGFQELLRASPPPAGR